MAFIGKLSLKNILQKACSHILVVVSFLICKDVGFLLGFRFVFDSFMLEENGIKLEVLKDFSPEKILNS